MPQTNEKGFHKRVEEAKSLQIYVDDKISLDSCIRGVYCFFAIKDDEEIPFYVGKANNIFMRMFKGHVYNYCRGVRKTDVQKRMQFYLDKGYKIKIKVQEQVDYVGDGFIQDANRLALAELNEIVKQQDKGFCITEDQLSEAVKKKEKELWEEQFLNSEI